MLTITLIQNVSLLIAIVVVYQALLRGLGERRALLRVVGGVLFGAAGVVSMLTPVRFAPGVIFDGRSIILSVAGLFGGPVVAVVAASIAAGYRLWLGGAGAWVGVGVIGEASVLGVAFRYLRRRDERVMGPLPLWGFGVVVHVVMLGLFALLPAGNGPGVISQLGLPMMVLYPVGTMLICLVLLEGEGRREAHEALRQAKRDLEVAQEIAHVGHWVFDPKTLEVQGSNEFFRLFGLRGPVQPASLLVDAVAPEDRERVAAALARAPGAPRRREVEHRLLLPDGTQKWIRTIVTASSGDGGGPRLVMGTAQDVTERKAYETEIERLSRLYAALGQIGQRVVRVGSREDLFQEACEVLTGQGKFKMAWIGLWDPPSDLLEPVARSGDELGYLTQVRAVARDCPEGRGPTGRAFRDGRTYVCQDFFTDPNTLPWRAVASGHGFLSSTALPIFFQGRVLAVLTVYAAERGVFGDKEVMLLEETARNISFAWEHLESEAVRRRTEEQLRDSEMRYRALFEQSPDGVVILDPQSATFLDFNDQACRQLGYSREEFRRLRLADVDAVESEAQTEAHVQGVLRKGRDDFETLQRTKQGDLRNVQVTAQTVEAHGKTFYHCIWRDVTEHRALEAQLRQAQKMEAIGTLAGGIAHDFNNILTPVMAHAELALLELDAANPARENITQLLAAAERAAALVEQILSASRKEVSGPLVPVPLGALIKEATRLLRASLPATIEILTEIDPACGPVLGDPSSLYQILLNLCTNAAHAMQERGGILTVSLRRVAGEPAGHGVRLSVQDTGTGIPPELVDRIFEPYFTTKPLGKGSGLGLAVVRGIVEKFGGTVRVESAPGQGSTFEVRLPETARAAPPDAEAQPVAGSAGQHVLVVDDEGQVRTVLAKMLLALGYRATEFAGGAEALAAFRAHPEDFDVVVTDYSMPGMTGLDLAGELLRVRPDLPVLLGTGFAEAVDDEVVAARGLRGLVMKPYSLQRLREALRLALAEPGSPGPAA